MSDASWSGIVRHVIDGEGVDANTTGRPTRDLERRTAYLRARLDAAELGQACVIYDATLESSVQVGHAVFYNATTQRYESALADAYTDSETGLFVIAASADVIGVVKSKTNATLGNIVVAGLAEVDLTATVDDPAVAGRYYLSGMEAGHLLVARPSISVPVLFNLGDGRVVIQPSMRDFFEDHVHWQFELTAVPAGDHATPAPGDPHVITDADDSLPGWLPADDASFDGNAPVGAKFGYNLSAHPALQRAWPPIPVESAVIEIVREADEDDTLFPRLGRVPAEFVVLDRYGIWWMSDCYGDVPWPINYAGSSAVSYEGDCPIPVQMHVILSFTKMTFATARSVVTSVQTSEGSLLTITDLDGQPATTGNLQIELAPDFQSEVDDEEGSLVLKTLDGEQFNRGRVTEGLIIGANLTVSSTHSRTEGDDTIHQGIVTLSADGDTSVRTLTPVITRLGSAAERTYESIPYIAFPAGRNSQINMRFEVPFDGIPADPVMVIRAAILARAAGTAPDMTMTYRRIPHATVATNLPLVDSSLTFDPSTAVTADQYFSKDSAEIAVEAGDVVLIILSRSDADAYSGEVGVLRVSGVISNND
jgi:hypothetical protein